MHERVRDSLLRWWGRAVTTHPKLTLAVCLGLAVVSVFATARSLEFRPDRSDLVDRELEWNRRYAEYKRHFPRWNDLVVCIEGEPGEPEVDALARHVADELRTDSRVAAADAGFYVAEASPRIFAIAPPREFNALIEQLEQARHVAAAENVNAFLAVALSELAESEGEAGALTELETILQPFIAALGGGQPSFDFLTANPMQWQPLVSEMGTGRLRFVQVKFAETTPGVSASAKNLNWLRQRVAALITDQADVDVDWGVTGVPAIEADETAQSMRDSTIASIIALALITALMLAVFRGLTVPLLAAGSLLIGLAWSFGWLIVSVGHLQVLSVVFSVILLGLGIDFALHVVSRLELIADEHESLTVAIPRVYVGIGPGMITGAVTTAAAFACTALTQFTGMKEMGIIAAGGIILCMIAVLSAFPAALQLTGKWDRIIRSRPGGETAHFAHGRLDFADAKPRRTILYTIIVAALLFVGAWLVRYDSNVLNLHPPGIESVIWERKIVTEASQSVWAALVETTPERAPALVERLRHLPEVADVGGMGLLFPPDHAQRAEPIQQLREQPLEPTAAPAGLTNLTPQLRTIAITLRLRLNGANGETQARLRTLSTQIDQTLHRASIAPPAAQAQMWQSLDDAFRAARSELEQWLAEALQPGEITPGDLPEVLRHQWIGADGEWLLKVYPASDPQGRPILDPARLGKFVRAVRSVAPDALGPPVQIFESSRLIKREYIKASCFAVAAILVLLLLDFRSLADAICAMTPVMLGFLGVFGLMGPLGVPLNFANIIVMPLIFGIGVDAGVHAVHRWRAEPFGRPAGLSGGTGRGITLTTATTMIGFGSMLFAEHRGIKSLAFVMLVGLGVTLLACYTTLPAILRLRTRDGDALDR
jgi:hopanoid biosynthesis associated RND transporter like protein HpnN